MEKHLARRVYQMDIATAFFRAGLIEAWGRGTLKIVRECKNAGLPAPFFTFDLSGFRIEFKKKFGKKFGKDHRTDQIKWFAYNSRNRGSS